MNTVIQKIKKLDQNDALTPHIEINFAEFNSHQPGFLSDSWIIKQREVAGLGKETESALLDIARTVREDETLAFLYFHCERLAFEYIEIYNSKKLMEWPSFDSLLPGRSDLFLLLLTLSTIERIQKRHNSMGISPEITAATCSDIASRVSISEEFKNGELGVSVQSLIWLRHHVRGDLLQFGRLQFHVIILSGLFRVYRRLKDGKYLMVVEPGMRFTSEGYHDGIGGELSAEHWYSDWKESNGMVTANAIGPEGRAQREPVTFNINEWNLILNRSSAVMNTHIPRGTRIQIEDWRQSIKDGFDFFQNQQIYSAKPVACVCRSWIFDSRLQKILPENSGLLNLQKRLRLFPFSTPLQTRNGFDFIFGDKDIDLDTAPRDTSLRRLVIDYAKAGGVLTGGGMIIFKDELEKRLSNVGIGKKEK